ncbi:hypothetical protein NDI45_11165 [Leptolyngbya sp. GB1-A1]|uniref:hypothetical protein n=1 Tax=Leptolyngbya sp. GB1-A1 TaxID=2933908 RepID=UPI003297999D
MSKPIDTAKCLTVINATSVLLAIKPSRNPSTVCITVAIVALNKLDKFYKPTTKAVVYEGLVEQQNLLTELVLSGHLEMMLMILLLEMQ